LPKMNFYLDIGYIINIFEFNILTFLPKII